MDKPHRSATKTPCFSGIKFVLCLQMLTVTYLSASLSYAPLMWGFNAAHLPIRPVISPVRLWRMKESLSHHVSITPIRSSPLSPHPLAIDVSLCEPDCRQPLSAANDAGTLRLLQSILSAWLHLQRGFWKSYFSCFNCTLTFVANWCWL